MTPIGAALREAAARIDAHEARALLCHALGCEPAHLIAHGDEALAPGTLRRFRRLVERRAGGEPVAYLVGAREFYGRSFRVSPAVLIPRPETELLVDLALERVRGRGAARVLDLGTGSGCVALSIAAECAHCEVTATDAAPDSLSLARANARALGATNVRFVHGDWYAPLAGGIFDVIVSNPPYVAEHDPHLSAGDLRFEPRGALVAGEDGMRCIREIAAGAPTHLAAGGWLLLEHGYDQGARCRAVLHEGGYAAVASWRDLAGHERVTGGRLTPSPAAG